MPSKMIKIFGKRREINGFIYVLSRNNYPFYDARIDFITLINLCSFQGINRNIEVENFQEINIPIENSKDYDYFLIRFKNEFSYKKLLNILNDLGVHPANLRELLLFFKMLSSKVQKRMLRFDIIALGSCWEDKKNKMKHRIPFINSKRKLRLSHEAHFTRADIFLVKKPKK